MNYEVIIIEIIKGVFSLIVGFFGGYTVGIKKNNKFKQKARDNSSQVQIGDIYNER